MARRPRIYYTQEQRALMWDCWKKGETLHQIGKRFDRPHTSIRNVLAETGGIRPADRSRSSLALGLDEREEISRALVAGESMPSMAARLCRAPSTISREIERNGGSLKYRAAQADQAAWDRAHRPKICKLALNPGLASIITTKLQGLWSPQQISGWLKHTYPSDETRHVSHETIYRTLFIQTRGALKKELLEHLRRTRGMRRSVHHTQKTSIHGQISDAVSISERPASAEDRAVPGHWEGDLLFGDANSQIATLVEGHTRYVMLVKLKAKDTNTVVDALIKHSRKLPEELYKSLTWDRGKEMAAHKKFTLATDIQVYFCDPQNLWQRGSNENTNGLLRQYFPKGIDISTWIARHDEFHAVVLKGCGSPRLFRAIRQMAQEAEIYHCALLPVVSRDHEMEDEHALLVKLVIDGDVDRALALLAQHQIKTRDQMLPLIQKRNFEESVAAS